MTLFAHATWIPINPPDVPALEALLEDADPFVAATFDTPSPYGLWQYRENIAANGEPVYALLDRNLLSRVVRLASGAVVDHSTESARTDRVAAATMAFLASADVELEPNIALYEVARTQNDHAAQGELALFQLSQDIPPQAFLNVALQRIECIDPDAIQHAKDHRTEHRARPAAGAFEAPLRQFNAIRAVLTKVALLKRAPMTPEERIAELIRWSSEEALFSGVAVAFAVFLFGRRGRPGMLKGVEARTFERCLAGIANSAWDLTYIAHWVSRSQADLGKGIWLFCTNDKLCADIAKLSVGRSNETHARLFFDNYPKSTAERLCELYERSGSSELTSQSRSEVVRSRLGQLSSLQEELELQLARTFQPS